MNTDETDQHTDGNAIAGVLQEIFVAEFTTLERTRLAVLHDQYVFELRGAWSRRSEI